MPRRSGSLLGLRDRVAGPRQAFEGVRHVRQQGLALRGEDQAAVQALEQRHAERLFQVLHLLADGTGRDGELRRGGLEAQVAAGGLEGAQSVEGRQAMAHGAGPGMTARASE